MKNLSSFAQEGKTGAVIPSVASLIAATHAAKKPIGALCIAPVLLAKVLGTANGGPGLTLTTGLYIDDTADLLRYLGNTAVPCGPEDAVEDTRNRVVTAPAYMRAEATPATVFDGAEAVVAKAFAMLT